MKIYLAAFDTLLRSHDDEGAWNAALSVMRSMLYDEMMEIDPDRPWSILGPPERGRRDSPRR